MLEGETNLVVAAIRVNDKSYPSFQIHVPPKIAKDSQFPFKPNQALRIDVDPRRMAVIISEANNPKPAPPTRRRKR